MDKLMNPIRLFLLCGMLLCVAVMQAQEADTSKKKENPVREAADDPEKKQVESLNAKVKDLESYVKSLKKNIENQQTDSAKKKNRIAELETENGILAKNIAKLQLDLDTEKKEGKATKYKERIGALVKDSTSLRKSLDELEKTRTLQHKADLEEIDSLKKELNALKDFRVKWLAELAGSVEAKWFGKPYSAIDLAKLEADFLQYDMYAKEDAAVAGAKAKLEPLLANCRLYQRAVKAVHSKYEEAVVEPLIAPIALLRDSTEAKFREELDKLHRQLEDYRITVEIFQEDIIGKVNEAVKGQESANAAFPLAKAVLDVQEEESGYITAIRDIPWLSDQYDKYYKALEENCLGANPTAEEILKLIPASSEP